MNKITIKTPKGERKIGPGEPIFIVAEMSGNHNQSFDRALAIIDAAAEAGVDAIKMQTYTPDTITIDCDNDYFKVKIENSWHGQTLYSLYQQAYTPWDWQAKLKEYGEKKGLAVFSTPFDETAVDFLEKIGVNLYKVASYEIVDLPLLKKIGSTKKPVMLARGMASIAEIELAIKTLREAGSGEIVVLQCISNYPAKPSDMNLRTIPDIMERFGVISGLSDHSLGITAAVTSVALGASVIEKHFTLSRADGGPDASFSLEPKEMKELVVSVRDAEQALGKPNYEQGAEEKIGSNYRRSLFVVEDIKKGEKFTNKNIRCIRPAYGLEPKYLGDILGKEANTDLKRGTPLKKEFIIWN